MRRYVRSGARRADLRGDSLRRRRRGTRSRTSRRPLSRRGQRALRLVRVEAAQRKPVWTMTWSPSDAVDERKAHPLRSPPRLTVAVPSSWTWMTFAGTARHIAQLPPSSVRLSRACAAIHAGRARSHRLPLGPGAAWTRDAASGEPSVIIAPTSAAFTTHPPLRTIARACRRARGARSTSAAASVRRGTRLRRRRVEAAGAHRGGRSSTPFVIRHCPGARGGPRTRLRAPSAPRPRSRSDRGRRGCRTRRRTSDRMLVVCGDRSSSLAERRRSPSRPTARGSRRDAPSSWSAARRHARAFAPRRRRRQGRARDDRRVHEAIAVVDVEQSFAPGLAVEAEATPSSAKPRCGPGHARARRAPPPRARDDAAPAAVATSSSSA